MKICPVKFFGHKGQGKCLGINECPTSYYAEESSHTCIEKKICIDAKKFIYVSNTNQMCITNC